MRTMRVNWLPLLLLALLPTLTTAAQGPDAPELEQEKLRGTITPQREWWDLRHYDLAVRVDIEKRTIAGTNTVRFQTLKPGRQLQIDLQPPLELTAARFNNQQLTFSRKGNVCLIDLPSELPAGESCELILEYEGQPTESRNPPWSGGFSWQKDSSGKPFVATSCQGIGASIWWPCKDHGYDEPEEGADIRLTVPAGLVAVSNGRLIKRTAEPATETETFHWRVTNPINNYSINANIGDYVNFGEKIQAECGPLDLEYWVLREQLAVAKEHFREAKRTIEAFEYWFGPYPFPEDSYKLVEVPYLGMEHQSSVTYGNGYRNGYRGRDLSGTGVGMKFDFIIVHESGHEWFGNNISMKDAADMWIHESFTNYSENLFVEYHFTQQEAEDYVIGCRKLVRNDSPIIGEYGLNRSGSGDMYYKGGNMLHTLRHMLNDTPRWREILRGLNREFRHQTVTTEQIEQYLARETGLELAKFFDQYLRGTEIPVFEYQVDGDQVTYRFTKVVDGFCIPLRVAINGQEVTLRPTGERQVYQASGPISTIEVNRNFYVLSEAVKF
ncbi:MAG: M1 family metallopeptidase [Planctomycetota bacterium]